MHANQINNDNKLDEEEIVNSFFNNDFQMGEMIADPQPTVSAISAAAPRIKQASQKQTLGSWSLISAAVWAPAPAAPPAPAPAPPPAPAPATKPAAKPVRTIAKRASKEARPKPPPAPADYPNMPTNIRISNAAMVVFPFEVREKMRQDLEAKCCGSRRGANMRLNNYYNMSWDHDIDGVTYTIKMKPQYVKNETRLRQWLMMIPCVSGKHKEIGIERGLYVAYLREPDSAFAGAPVTKKTLWMLNAAAPDRELFDEDTVPKFHKAKSIRKPKRLPSRRPQRVSYDYAEEPVEEIGALQADGYSIQVTESDFFGADGVEVPAEVCDGMTSTNVLMPTIVNSDSPGEGA